MIRLLAVGLLALFAITGANTSHAAECTVGLDAMNFDAVDTLDAGAVTSADLTIVCTEVAGEAVSMCVELGDGTHPTEGAYYVLASANDTMIFGLSADAAGSIPWGSSANPNTGLPREINLSAVDDVASTTVAIFGLVPGGQLSASIGTYNVDLAVSAHYLEADNLDCTSFSGTALASGNLSVSATVEPNCRIEAQDVNFGTVGIIDEPITASGGLDVLCTPGANFSVDMGDGNHHDGGSRNMRSPEGNLVSYGLFRDQPGQDSWDNPYIGIATGNDDQPVFGRITPQDAVPGSYADTVTVTIEYD